MWGAVIGDIAGSIYEGKPVNTEELEFFTDYCFYTDDSVCTAAVAEILLDNLSAAPTLQRWCRNHPDPDRGYGHMFGQWITLSDPKPYNSYGNGSAMRVSPAAFLNRNHPLEEALAAADRVTEITHNHPEGMKGARATAHAIWLAFQKYEPKDIRRTIEREYSYDLSRTLDQVRSEYSYNEICQETVPEAITCALESTSFENAVRNAISLGGDADTGSDSDTLAAIAGPIAEAIHGIPHDLVAKAKGSHLAKAPDIVNVIARMYETQV